MFSASRSAAVVLAVGDLVVVDSVTSNVVRVDPITGAQTLLQHIGGSDLAVDGNGILWITNTAEAGGVLRRFDPRTGASKRVANGLGETATGVSVAPDGKIVTGSFGIGSAVRSYDPQTGANTVLGEVNRDLQGVAVAAGGDIFDAPELTDDIRRLDAAGVFQQSYPLIGTPEFGRPGDIAFTPDGDLIIVDVLRDVFVKLDVATGAQTILDPLIFEQLTWGLAVEPGGTFVFPADPTPGGGAGIWRFDPVTGNSTLVTSGGLLSGNGLSSVAVVPGPAAAPSMSPGAISVLVTLLVLSATLALRRSASLSA
jgi:streptogramin lyase